METAASLKQSDLTQVWRRRQRRASFLFILLALGAVTFFILSIAFGSASIPLSEIVAALFGRETSRAPFDVIVWHLRLPRALTATVAGAALGLSGLQMQTLFRNPLADPYILGISAGASLGVGVVTLSSDAMYGRLGSSSGALQNLSLVAAAALGAAAVLAVMLAVASRVQGATVLLIIGVMIGAFASAVVSAMVWFASPQSLQAFAAWGAGSFRGLNWRQTPIFVAITLTGMALAALTTKQLNALLLGEQYARSLGVSVRRLRILTMISASLMAGTVTAFCGPIAFLGIATPHLARNLFGSSDHRVIVPGAILLGSALALLCGLFAELPGSNTTVTLPLNAATALIGAPVVVWILLRMWRASSAPET